MQRKAAGGWPIAIYDKWVLAPSFPSIILLMTPNLANSTTRSTRSQFVAEFGSDDFSGASPDHLAQVKALAAPEDWGDEDFVLQRYLAVHAPLAIEHGRYDWDGKRLVMRAGNLATARGAGIYLGLARADGNRWTLNWAGERPSNVELLLPVDLGAWPALDPGREVVVAFDRFLSKELAGLPLITKNLVIAGAVEWSLRRGLAVRQLHGNSRGYLAPVHLTDRHGAPTVVAPIQVQADRLVIRALIEPHVAYAAARPLVERREDLPAWLLDSWSAGRRQ